jgi:choline dehydrogenase
VVARPAGVGENLQDHLELYVQYAGNKTSEPVLVAEVVEKGMAGAQWLWQGKGGPPTISRPAAFIRSNDQVEYPNIQYHFLPIAIRYDGSAPKRDMVFSCTWAP